jgi:hypothetical protein
VGGRRNHDDRRARGQRLAQVAAEAAGQLVVVAVELGDVAAPGGRVVSGRAVRDRVTGDRGRDRA